MRIGNHAKAYSPMVILFHQFQSNIHSLFSFIKSKTKTAINPVAILPHNDLFSTIKEKQSSNHFP